MKPSIFKPEQAVTIATTNGSIEALFADQNSGVNAIICAPHPHHDGSMHNKVVATMTQVCLDQGLNTLRFNYRGVGASTGDLPTYAAALQDVTFVKEYLPSLPTICLGFSYGSYVAAYLSGLVVARGLITVAPSVAKMPFADLPTINCAWYMLQGMQDEVIDIPSNYKLSQTTQCHWLELEDCGHFFHGKLSVLRETLVATLTQILDGNA